MLLLILTTGYLVLSTVSADDGSPSVNAAACAAFVRLDLSTAYVKHGSRMFQGRTKCNDSHAFGVTGNATRVRLVNGTLPNEGRVEVLHQGFWGTVCHDSWDNQDAEVVCRMLGYKEAISAPRDSAFGAGKGRILLDDVNCTGKESDIAECDHSGWGEQNCDHSQDASVICSSEVRKVKKSGTTCEERDCSTFCKIIVDSNPVIECTRGGPCMETLPETHVSVSNYCRNDSAASVTPAHASHGTASTQEESSASVTSSKNGGGFCCSSTSTTPSWIAWAIAMPLAVVVLAIGVGFFVKKMMQRKKPLHEPVVENAYEFDPVGYLNEPHTPGDQRSASEPNPVGGDTGHDNVTFQTENAPSAAAGGSSGGEEDYGMKDNVLYGSR